MVNIKFLFSIRWIISIFLGKCFIYCVHALDGKFVPKCQTHIASVNMEFRGNSTGWRVSVPLEYLFDKPILKYWPLNVINHDNTSLLVRGHSKSRLLRKGRTGMKRGDEESNKKWQRGQKSSQKSDVTRSKLFFCTFFLQLKFCCFFSHEALIIL